MSDPAVPRSGRPAFEPGRALLVVSVLLPALLFGLAAWQNRRQVERETVARVERTVSLLHEHAIKVFETHRLVMDQIHERLRTIDLDRPEDAADLHRLLQRLEGSLDQVAAITITDAAGRLRASSRTLSADSQVSFADRDWFEALRSREPDRLYVSRSYTGRQSGQRVFNVADRVAGPEGGEGAAGSFQGAIAISVDRAYFERFYASVEPELSHNVLLVRQDGAILARVPRIEAAFLPPDTEFRRLLQSADQATFTARSGVDGTERIFSYRRVGAFPVYVGFGISREAAFATWRRNLANFGLVALLSAAALLCVSMLAIRQTRRERLATAGWRAAAAEARTEVDRRSRAEAQLRQSQKMEAVGRLTGGVAHDFNNLLTVVTGNLDMLRQRLSDSADVRSRRYADNALEGARRAATLTQRLLAFSRQSPLQPQVLDANKLVGGMSDLFQRTLGEDVSVETVLAGGLWAVEADPNQLESALLNLAVNARDAMPDGGKLTIETQNAHLDDAYAAACRARGEDVQPGQYVLIAVGDTGAGMSGETLARVFEPFFTTKEVGRGTGLGLSQVYGFLKQSGGHAAIYSELGHGTTVKLYLRRHKREGAGAAAPDVSDLPAGLVPSPHAETILVIEDEAMVRQFSVAALEEAGYRVLAAGDGPSGLALLDAHPEIVLMFTDVVLVGPLNGREVADRARGRRPDLKVLFTTGYTRNAIIHHGRLDDDVDLVGKPFTAGTLTRRVARALLCVDESPTR